jgi:hypothetical protein
MAEATMLEPGSAFAHHACIYASGQEFLAMAIPFVRNGLALDEPVLVATTAANLQLLGDALYADADKFDYAETAYFGRRPPQRVAAFHRYWQRHASGNHRHVRVLAEPVWAGRSDRQVTAWQRMESALNVVLSATNIWMICPYDARVVDQAILRAARQTHPDRVEGGQIQPSGEFVDPVAFAYACDATPLPDPSPDAPLLPVTGVADLASVRRFVASQAAAHGLSGERVKLLVYAASEAAGYLLEQGSQRLTVCLWTAAGQLACQINGHAGLAGDAFAGLRPPAMEPRPGDGLWLAQQVCDLVEVRAHHTGCRILLQVPGPHAEELVQTGVPYTS